MTVKFVCDNNVFSDTTSLFNYLMDSHPYKLLALYSEQHIYEPMPTTGCNIFTDTCHVLHSWFYERITYAKCKERPYNPLFLEALDIYVDYSRKY